ncbi:MAG: pyrroline-5-carboxylate reductase [Nitrospirota bacterium]|jgi:pyrroline-5-carboxylate reductase
MIGFIGGGNMAEALLRGMAGKGLEGVQVSEPSEERRRHLESALGVAAFYDNPRLARTSDIVLLAVKPQGMEAVLEEIRGALTPEKTVVSIAAGITLRYLEERLGTRKLVRVMPNMGAMVGESMSVLSLCECFAEGEITPVRDIFMSSGRVLVLPEKYMDAVTALSGSGPAFLALFVEAMARAGEQAGLRESDARELALQTLRGTAALLDSGLSPERMIEMVRSPGGTTAAGLEVFEKRALRLTVAEALQAAARRAAELAR